MMIHGVNWVFGELDLDLSPRLIIKKVLKLNPAKNLLFGVVGVPSAGNL
jgi:hypothetical protein